MQLQQPINGNEKDKILRDNKHVSDKSMMDKIGVKIAIEISQNEA